VRGAEVVVGLVVVAVMIASLAGRLRAPAPSLLVIAGLLIGLIPGAPTISIPPEAISVIVLPPLLYAAAQDVSLRELRSVAGQVALLAVGLVAATAVAVAFAMHAVAPQIGLATAFVVGAALASTDPVAVAALARRLHLPPRLLALVQGESLLNDATSLVLFTVAVSVSVRGGGLHLGSATVQFLRLGLGGAAVGAVIAVATAAVHRRTADPVVDVAVSLVTPFAAFVAAEALGCSGVTAVVVAGLAGGDRRLTSYDGRVRLIVTDVYEVVVFLLESAVFAVIGLQLPELVRRLPDSERHAGIAIALVTAVLVGTRIVWVFATARIPARIPTQRPATWRGQLIVTWAGTRGVVPLTASLSIPLTVDGGAAFPHRDLLLLVISACITVTLVVQGLSLAPLVRRFGVAVPAEERKEHERVARVAAANAALIWLDGVTDADNGAAGEKAVVLDRLRREFEGRAERLADPQTHGASTADYRRLRAELLAVQSAALVRLRDSGRITESTRRRVQRSLDVEEASLIDRRG
jgi:CPA1 family monovalent cation:H+ antiporter